jgi:hypothetical protein
MNERQTERVKILRGATSESEDRKREILGREEGGFIDPN